MSIRLACLLALSAALATMSLPANATAGCTEIKAKITNPAEAHSSAHVTKLGVRLRTGGWRPIQTQGERVLAPGRTYHQTFVPTKKKCGIERRYRAFVKCVDTNSQGISTVISKGWVYSAWRKGNRGTLNTGCQ